MKLSLICLLLSFGAIALAEDAKPGAPKAPATESHNIDKVPPLPPTPPRLTVEASPGSAYAIAFYENSQIKVSADKVTELKACIAEVAAANLIGQHSTLRTLYATAEQAAKDAILVAKDNDRDQERADRCQKAADSDKKNATKAKQLALAKKDLGTSTPIRKKREEQAATSLATYTKALDAYNQALAGVTPAIDRFVSTAGFPKDHVGK